MDKEKIEYPKEVLDVIPQGMYCYHYRGKVCPFWLKVKGRPYQEDAFCVLLGKGDVEINKECENDSCPVTECGPEGQPCHTDVRTYKEWGPPFNKVSLLWDKCKECGLNDEEEPDDEEAIGSE